MLLANQARTSSSSNSTPPPPHTHPNLHPLPTLHNKPEPAPLAPLLWQRVRHQQRDETRRDASCNYEACHQTLPMPLATVPAPQLLALSLSLCLCRAGEPLRSLCGSHKCIMLITGNNFMNLCKRCQARRRCASS